MRVAAALSTFALLAASTVSARRSGQHVGKTLRSAPKEQRGWGLNDMMGAMKEKRQTPHQYLTNKTESYAVDGTAIPDVNFDVGESYAGLMPVATNGSTNQELYFWFFPSENELAGDEILIWLNGGPGCSSLEGLLQENGPFLWQYGTYQPVPNPWSWTNLTNVVWVEQPVGTGFSQGHPTITDEVGLAKQFMGFWKNFVDTFDLTNRKVYITGESYAGMYVPYIASAFLDQNDTEYYGVEGTIIYDPVITYDTISNEAVAVPFVDYWKGLFPFNDSFVEDLHAAHESCGYADYLEEYFVFPPKGPQPAEADLPGGRGCELWDSVYEAAMLVNPCWDVYQVATTCPLLWDVLGFPGSFDYVPEGADVYFNRSDVQTAINAPQQEWESCQGPVFLLGDRSAPSATTVLPGVIERSKRTIIGHGALDFILLANGTLLGIQNMTWNGAMGFSELPTDPFYVPYHTELSDSTLAASGIFGTTITERNLTFVGIDLSGHMVPQYAPSAAYRHVEYLLGRIDSLSSTVPFTTDTGVAQPNITLGTGTAPPYKKN